MLSLLRSIPAEENLSFQKSKLTNLVPRVSHLTVPWSELQGAVRWETLGTRLQADSLSRQEFCSWHLSPPDARSEFQSTVLLSSKSNDIWTKHMVPVFTSKLYLKPPNSPNPFDFSDTSATESKQKQTLVKHFGRHRMFKSRYRELDHLDFLSISNSKHLPLVMLFSQFTAPYLEPSPSQTIISCTALKYLTCSGLSVVGTSEIKGDKQPPPFLLVPNY